jgi:anaerobic magnesium-protoporphyrin IX monomethyl ester cyclase
MNVLLIYPRPNIFKPSSVVPLGLAYLASVLEQSGNRVIVNDLNVEPDRIDNIIKNEPIDLVGISASTPMIKSAWSIAKKVKNINKNATVVLGGPHPSALPEEALKYEDIDIVVRGEGEYTLMDLCKKMEDEVGLESIDGISYKNNGYIKHNIAREYIKNLDELPFPAYHLFPSLDNYTPSQPLLSNSKRSAAIITSRGCPENCIFCYKEIFGSKYRMRSSKNVIDEWKMLVEELKVQEIAIQDDTFTLHKKRAIEICNMIKKEGLDVDWSTPNGIRVDTVNSELLSSMKQAGCKLVWFGVESGSQRVLDEIVQKKINLNQVEKAITTAKRVGLEVGTFFVLGMPGETEEEMQMSIDFAKKLDPDYCQFTICGPFPGTRLYTYLIEKNIRLLDDWDLFGHYEGHAYFEYEGVNKEIIEKMYKKAYKKFYLRPNYILKFFTKKETYLNITNTIKGASHFICGDKFR